MISDIDTMYTFCQQASRGECKEGTTKWRRRKWVSMYFQLSCVAYPADAALLEKAKDIGSLASEIYSLDCRFQKGLNDPSVR